MNFDKDQLSDKFRKYLNKEQLKKRKNIINDNLNKNLLWHNLYKLKLLMDNSIIIFWEKVKD